jgi:hypothetical protein
MTIVISPTTVSAAIAGLSITGVTIKDIDEMPDSVNMLTPLIVPQPNNFISAVRPQRQSFGSGGTQKMDFTYSLNYQFIHSPVGSGINAFAPYNDVITKLVSIINTILNNDTVNGLVDMGLQEIGQVGIITDPAGDQYWGCLFSVICLEHAQ